MIQLARLNSSPLHWTFCSSVMVLNQGDAFIRVAKTKGKKKKKWNKKLNK